MHRFLFSIFLFFSTVFFAQKDSSRATLLWSISGKGIQTSYLFGTIHLIPTNKIIFTKQLTKLISSSDKIVLELDKLPNSEEMSKQIELNSSTLFSLFTKQQVDSILEWSNTIFHLNKEQTESLFGQLKPIHIAQVHLQASWMGAITSYEEKIIELAKTKNKQVLGLETVTEQLTYLDRIPVKDQVEMVMMEVREPNKCLQEFDTLVNTYIQQDLRKLEHLFSSKLSLTKETENALLKERNAKWIPKIIPLFDRKEQIFIAVGAAHLIGPDGLISYLEKLGYILTPIRL